MSRVVSLAGSRGRWRLLHASRLTQVEFRVHHTIAHPPLDSLFSLTMEPRLVAVNCGHDLLQPRFDFPRERRPSAARWWHNFLPLYGRHMGMGRALFRCRLSIAKAQKWFSELGLRG
jgi:hypothetical protein